MKVLEWLKKNSKYVILAIVVVVTISWISFRELRISKQTKKIAELELSNSTLELANKDLDIQLKGLQLGYDSIRKNNDYLKTALRYKQKEFDALVEKHKKVIDSLTNIPPDTVYRNLGELYPNFDNLPLAYPFSSSQIVPMYKTIVSYPLLLEEYELQGLAFKTCLDLTSGYESGIANLNSQISNLQSQVSNYDSQVNNYKREITLINRKVSRRGFWNKLLITTTAIATGVAILK